MTECVHGIPETACPSCQGLLASVWQAFGLMSDAELEEAQAELERIIAERKEADDAQV
jgi:hypothetical protein